MTFVTGLGSMRERDIRLSLVEDSGVVISCKNRSAYRPFATQSSRYLVCWKCYWPD